MSKRSIYLVILTIVTFLGLVVSAAFAYYGGNTSMVNTVNISMATPAKPIFTSYSNNSLALVANDTDFSTASTTAAATDTGNLIVTLSATNSPVTCTYDVKLVWNTTDQYTPTTTLPVNSSYPYELSISGTRTTTGDTTGISYTNKNVTETNLSNLTWTGNAGTVGRYSKIVSGAEIHSKSTTATVTTWTYTMNFYVLPTNQNALSGKEFGLNLIVDNVSC